eukprot:CAMPEP_0178408640 /NCGR_PEP_ID=MMETSP0689_2-20121128/20047_1 /TAXON_ID=160604 /ORGANISM="Amphidinium massartii, Strain CS-259" /LENGTH=65 /DNA_ID=CAMNT_0020029749 /DNA_START=322 /DNA_END=519 /DNA_ORIENTATION=-
MVSQALRWAAYPLWQPPHPMLDATVEGPPPSLELWAHEMVEVVASMQWRPRVALVALEEAEPTMS